MNEYTIVFKEGFAVGLRSSDKNPKNSQALVESQSAFPEGGMLRSTDEINTLDFTALGCTFPFPQIFQLKQFTLVCTPTKIYTYDGGLNLVYTAAEGSTWTVADFDLFLVLCNGKELVTLNPTTGVWSKYTECALDCALCVCELNGQLFVGGPDASIFPGFLV